LPSAKDELFSLQSKLSKIDKNLEKSAKISEICVKIFIFLQKFEEI